MRKALLWLGALVAAAVLYNLDAITGQWKFDKLCKEEGGPRFYGSVEKDVGWEVEGHDTYDYQGPFPFEHIAFVRYENKQGIRSDVRADGYIGAGERKYIFTPVDAARPVRYRFRTERITLPDDARFGRTQQQVVDLSDGRVVASYTYFGYSWTKPERVILAAPTGVQCWVEENGFQQFYQGIYNFGSKK